MKKVSLEKFVMHRFRTSALSFGANPAYTMSLRLQHGIDGMIDGIQFRLNEMKVG